MKCHKKFNGLGLRVGKEENLKTLKIIYKRVSIFKFKRYAMHVLCMCYITHMHVTYPHMIHTPIPNTYHKKIKTKHFLAHFIPTRSTHFSSIHSAYSDSSHTHLHLHMRERSVCDLGIFLKLAAKLMCSVVDAVRSLKRIQCVLDIILTKRLFILRKHYSHVFPIISSRFKVCNSLKEMVDGMLLLL